MSSTDEAIKSAQARAKNAAESATDQEHHAQGDISNTTQKVSNEHAAKHGDASGMTSASDQHHETTHKEDSKAHKDDQVSGIGSSSS